MKTHLEVELITGWEQNKVLTRKVKCVKPQDSAKLNDELFEDYKNKNAPPACGNLHAGKGRFRTISHDQCNSFNTQKEIFDEISTKVEDFGARILISAGHFMPNKKDRASVNSNSQQSLEHGVQVLGNLLEKGKKADLLITINDVTINPLDEKDESLPTMSKNERSTFYDDFKLPSAYVNALSKLAESVEQEFRIFIVGENKLASKLGSDAKKKKLNGYLSRPENGKSYTLSLGKERLKHCLKVAHGVKEEENSFYNLNEPIFISHEAGVTGRPKCVRACTRLSALPYEMNYTGYIQFLPVCSRNALEGFLIGSEIYSNMNKHRIPFLSVHNVFSCF